MRAPWAVVRVPCYPRHVHVCESSLRGGAVCAHLALEVLHRVEGRGLTRRDGPAQGRLHVGPEQPQVGPVRDVCGHHRRTWPREKPIAGVREERREERSESEERRRGRKGPVPATRPSVRARMTSTSPLLAEVIMAPVPSFCSTNSTCSAGHLLEIGNKQICNKLTKR